MKSDLKLKQLKSSDKRHLCLKEEKGSFSVSNLVVLKNEEDIVKDMLNEQFLHGRILNN